ncbi:MAG: AmmeMemoRadiSam system radical SAM enzyme [Candidatus Thermoplasmatota archaeon]|nr:AmmeMemoRadiSam system radical SAM enzyme [Candidatus Thermoplasmatota archaeon]
MKEASYYEVLEDGKVRCNLCPHHCVINPGKTGNCKVRKNVDGKLFSLVFGKPIAQSTDPIEKKPLFHFYPGSKAFSIATVGCNMHCLHCQNADISQVTRGIFPDKSVRPEQIVDAAKRSGAKSIAFTYTEPTIFYEYAFETAHLSHKEGLKNVFVTNGYIEQKPLEDIASVLDAANIDLKGMTDDFYKKVCGARLQPVLDAIKQYYELGIWIEITTLIIPGYNDDKEMLSEIARFIANIDSNIPWHVTGFYPTYKLTDVPPTQASSLEKAVNIGKKAGLQYVYQGNRRAGEDTFCPKCGKQLITRSGFFVSKNLTNQGKCPSCHTSIAGIHIK